MTLPITHDDLTDAELENMLRDCIERRRRKIQRIKDDRFWTWLDVANALPGYTEGLRYTVPVLESLMTTKTFSEDGGSAHLSRERCCERLGIILRHLNQLDK